ncbi:MAG: hypothetical protein IPI66_12490 [Chitinophagaceae bacterium]|nr:hypothetical protein [Chitinophagaceae bacterium]MBL0056381.1 hypothetical protein [Chitinophagaceae bacterium]
MIKKISRVFSLHLTVPAYLFVTKHYKTATNISIAASEAGHYKIPAQQQALAVGCQQLKLSITGKFCNLTL